MRKFFAMLRQIASPQPDKLKLEFTPIRSPRPRSPWDAFLPDPPALTFWLGADGERPAWCVDVTGMTPEQVNDMLASGRVTTETGRTKALQVGE